MPRASQKATQLPKDETEEIKVKDDLPTVEIVEPEAKHPEKATPWFPFGGDEDDDWQLECRNILAPGVRRVQMRYRDRKTGKLLPQWETQDGLHYHVSEKTFTR